MASFPGWPDCEECRRIIRELRSASRADRQALRLRTRDVARASGRGTREFAVGWVLSVAAMPDEEMRRLLKSHHPSVAEATRWREAHEAATGHSLKGWWILSQYLGDERE